MSAFRILLKPLLLIAALMVAGTAAYRWVEGWSLLDSIYMVVITLSTVGFREVRNLSPAGQVITMGIILVGLVAISVAVGSFSRMLLEGEIRRVLGRRRMEKELSKLRDHYIICGYGRVGRIVCRELQEEGVSVVVIDADERATQRADADGHLYVLGEATEEETLEAAGIERAKGLVLALPDEADNVYVTLLAKDVRPDLYVLARGISDNGERRLLAAGADRVISPNIIGGHRLAQAVLRPSVVEFVDIVTGRRHLELQLDELKVPEGSQFADRTIGECDVRRNYGLVVVGIIAPDGKMTFNPAPDDRIPVGSTLIVLGHRENLDRFAESV